MKKNSSIQILISCLILGLFTTCKKVKKGDYLLTITGTRTYSYYNPNKPEGHKDSTSVLPYSETKLVKINDSNKYDVLVDAQTWHKQKDSLSYAEEINNHFFYSKKSFKGKITTRTLTEGSYYYESSGSSGINPPISYSKEKIIGTFKLKKE
jgi:ABC-type oligopeptide transport system substrate-binding subunit